MYANLFWEPADTKPPGQPVMEQLSSMELRHASRELGLRWSETLSKLPKPPATYEIWLNESCVASGRFDRLTQTGL